MRITRLFVIDISNSIKWLAELYSLDTIAELSQRETMSHVTIFTARWEFMNSMPLVQQ